MPGPALAPGDSRSKRIKGRDSVGLRVVLNDRQSQRRLPGVGQGGALPILDQRDPEKVPGHLHELYYC